MNFIFTPDSQCHTQKKQAVSPMFYHGLLTLRAVAPNTSDPKNFRRWESHATFHVNLALYIDFNFDIDPKSTMSFVHHVALSYWEWVKGAKLPTNWPNLVPPGGQTTWVEVKIKDYVSRWFQVKRYMEFPASKVLGAIALNCQSEYEPMWWSGVSTITLATTGPSKPLGTWHLLSTGGGCVEILEKNFVDPPLWVKIFHRPPKRTQ